MIMVSRSMMKMLIKNDDKTVCISSSDGVAGAHVMLDVSQKANRFVIAKSLSSLHAGERNAGSLRYE